MTRSRHNLGNGPLVVAVLAITVLACLLVLFTDCGRAQAQAPPPKVPVPPGASTDCGPNGARHPINFASTDPATRWGYCAGNPGDSSKCRTTRDSGRDRRARCAAEEYENGAYYEAAVFKSYGCNPAPGTVPRFNADYLNFYDAAFAVDVLLTLQCERCNACGLTCVQCPGSRPRPTPTPAATPQPTATPVEQPTPTPVIQNPCAPGCEWLGHQVCRCPDPQPKPTPCPSCPPPVVCETCDRYEEMPARHRETYLAAPYWPRPLTRARQQRLNEANAWTRAHPKTWYVPSVLSNGLGITSTIEQCGGEELAWQHEECLRLTRERAGTANGGVP